MTLRRYDREGLQALEPSAFFQLFAEPPNRANATRDDAEIVTVRGPLTHHAGWWCDSYEDIVERVRAAVQTAASTVVLRVDSPGGDATGCFEAAREIRSICDAAGKRLLAYVEGQACSAGYALACSAERIVAAPSARVGSVGVIMTRIDMREADAKWGVRISVIASGARKADGHPSVEMGDEERAVLQRDVDDFAALFFDLVAEYRPLSTVDVAALEARVVLAAEGARIGLIDGVGTLDSLLAEAATGGDMPDEEKDDMKDARSALERAAESDDEEKAAKARKALKALDGDGDDEDEKEDEEQASAAASTAAAAPSTSVSASTAADVARIVAAQEARIKSLEAEREASARSALLASRPDIGRELRGVLASKPLADVQAIVAALPRPTAPDVVDPSATRGQGQGERSNDGPPSPHAERMARAFGDVLEDKPLVRVEGTRQIFEAAPRKGG